MVQQSMPPLDAAFAALADGTRRGILAHLATSDASITELSGRFGMTLTGLKKHVAVLERAGLVATRKVGRVRTCTLGPNGLSAETDWIEDYRRLWSARFDALEQVVQDLKASEMRDEHDRTD